MPGAGDVFASAGVVAGVAVAAGVASAVGDGAAVGAGVACGAESAGALWRTERLPVSADRDNISAINIKRAAAPIVILASSVAVPRGPKAVLDTLLEKSAPASDLPGCNRTAITRTIQDKIKRLYKT